jgi:selenium metabolism protein YedF
MEIDARNITCPKPVVMTLEALRELPAGEQLDVLINDEVAHNNLVRLAEDKGITLGIANKGDYEVLTFAPEGAVAVAEEELDVTCNLPAPGAPVILVGSRGMGSGSEELGGILMKGFLYALGHQETVPERIIFFNDGAYLTCEGSESLEDLKELERLGTEILTCGTCLDFHEMREKLMVGGVTNLYVIAENVLSKNVVTL